MKKGMDRFDSLQCIDTVEINKTRNNIKNHLGHNNLMYFNFQSFQPNYN